MTDFRALCAELQEAVQLYAGLDPAAADTPVNQRVARLMDAMANTTAALAQPEPQGPMAWMYRGEPYFDGERWRENWKVTLDEKVARFNSGNKEPVPLWGRPAIEPVPVSERLPGPEDCDAEGWCWLQQPHPATPEAPVWRLMPAKYASTIYCTTHWLSHWALPVPGVEGEQ
jgi:hypothetical protein